jgi:hypothetical protein
MLIDIGADISHVDVAEEDQRLHKRATLRVFADVDVQLQDSAIDRCSYRQAVNIGLDAL